MSESLFPILRNAGARPGLSTSMTGELERLLRNSIRGKVQFDVGARALYATDASNYRQMPIGIVWPLDVSDVEAVIAACRSVGAPVLSRGAGTSLSGQTCNSAVILDFSRYMRSILVMDPNERQAVVEPGVVLDRVREAAEVYNLTFAPDPATHNRCTIGGMIGNNSCGTHALMGGKTVDNVKDLDILLYDGTRLRVGPTSEVQYQEIVSAGGRPAQLYRELRRIRDTYADEIRTRFPKIPRRVSGYNLDQLLPENGFDLARALVGSEGTLVTVVGATLKLVHSPPIRRLIVVAFRDAFAAADAVPRILQFAPIGLEGFDSLLVDFMRRKSLALEDVKLLPEGGGFLLVEFGDHDESDADRQVRDFANAVRELDSVLGVRALNEGEAARVWHVRESALGATVFVPGEPQGWEGWEDAAVPPASLGSYLRAIYALMIEFGYRSPLYGHFGQGCVHLRINFDFETEKGIRKFSHFIDRAADIVVAHGGSISGEHGDGQARASLLPKMFGERIMQAFREFKAAWDPDNKMNPGKLVDPVDVYRPTDNLRLQLPAGPALKTHFSFHEDKGSFERAALRCVGVGACRKEDSGVMCPSYMVTREEQHSTRGRAHLLWEMMRGELRSEGAGSEAVKDALDLCLSCKACKNECPVNVDMATYKAEFLAHYFEHRRRPLSAYAFGMMDRWASMASHFPSIADSVAGIPFAQNMLRHFLGIASERRIPRFAQRSFRQSFRSERKRLPPPVDRPSVLLWADTWNNYFRPETALAAWRVLDDAGFEVLVPSRHLCCGRPLYDFGMLDQAKKYLHRIYRELAQVIERGIPVVVLEPSCASVFRDEALNLLANDPKYARLSETLARQTFLFSEFLIRFAPKYSPMVLKETKALLQGHCHQAPWIGFQVQLLESTGASVQLLDSGCCGMAGPFGFERGKYEVSRALADRVLLPSISTAPEGTYVVADGFSCREQIEQLSGHVALHIAELLSPGQPVLK